MESADHNQNSNLPNPYSYQRQDDQHPQASPHRQLQHFLPGDKIINIKTNMNQSQVKSSVTYGQQKRKVNIQRQNASTKSQRERTSNNQQDLAPYQQKNILGKLPDQKVQQVSSSSQISQRIGKVQSRDSLRAQLCPIDPEKVNNASSNFSAALVSLLQGQNNIDKFSVTFSGQQVSNGQSNSGLNKTLATYVNQSQLNNNAAQTIPADQLAINIKSSFRDGGKHQNKNQKAKVTQSGRVHLIDDGNQMVYVYDQYGTQPGDRALNSLDEHLLAPKLKPQQVQRHQSVQNSTKLSQQLNKVSYGRKNSSNSRGYQNNKEEGNNSLAPIFDGSSSFNKPQGRSNFNGRIIIQRGTGRHQNSSKSFILEEQKNHFENGTQLYLGPSHPTQNVQFNNYSAKGPTEAYTTQNQTVQTPSQQVPVMLDDQRVRIVKKPPTQRQKRKSIQNSDAESQEIIQVQDQLKTQFNKLYDVKNQKTIQSNTVSQNNQNVNSDNQAISQTRDQPPVIIDDQIPSRLESLIKQLIIRKQVSVSPNFQLKRPNGQNYFDQSSFLTNELTNLAHQSLQHPLQHPLKNNDQQKDVLSTFTAMTQNDETVKVEANTINNSFQDQFNMIGVQPEKSVENTGSIKGKQSEWFQQSSPKHKINVTSGEHGLDNLSKDLGMESLINYQELFNSKDILGSSLPISHTLHLALSNALKETNQNYLRNTSNVDQRSLALTNSPERQLSVQEKQDISKIFYNNLNKAQQNFISLDLQPKSVDSAEEIYEQTLNAFQQDINSLHEIEQSRQEISTRIREHQRILNRLHNVQQQNRGSLLVQNQNARQVSQPLQQTLQSIGINQKGSVELPPSNMSQIDFALMNRAQQNSVQPTLYDQRSFVSTQMQQHYALQNETQYQSYNSPQVVNIARGSVGGDKQNLASSPKVGRYRLKGMQGALNYPQQANHQVYSNRVQFPNETKRNKSVRQRGSRHIIPLASTSVGGSNLRSGGRKYITTQQNSSTKGYGTIDNHSTFQPLQNKKTQTGYLAMGSALTTIDQGKQMHQQHLGTNYSNKIKSTTIVYGPTGYSSIGSNSNGRASVPKQRQQLSNLRPAFQSNINKAGRSFSNRNRVLQQSLVNNNTSVKIARNTYASICSGSQTSQTYHYGNQTSSIDPKQTNKNSTNALETLNDDRSISPHPTKSRRIVKKNAVAQHRDAIPIRKGYKKSTSRVRGEVVAASSIVAGIRKHSKINTQQNVLPKAAQMSQQQVTIRDSLQETNPNSSILIAINKPSSTCMSPFEKEQQTFDSRMSPEKIRIVQLQQKLQLSESNGVRQVRIRGMQTRNHFSNDTGGRNDEVFHTHEMSGQDFRVGGQVIIIGATNGPTNVQKDSHNLRYSRATYDFQNNSYEELPQIDVKNLNQEQEKSHLSMIDKQSRIESMQKIDQNHKKQPTHTEEKRRKDVIMKLINEDNPFENPPQIIRSPVAQLQEQVSAFNEQSQYAHADKSLASKTTGASSAVANAYKQSRGRFTGNSGGRISLLAAGAMRRSETTEDSQQCKYMDATMQMTSLPMPMQSINHQIIAEEEAAAEQDEKSTNKESSTQHGKPVSNNRGQENSSSTPNQSDPTIKYTPPSVGSVEDECLIGDDSSNHFEKEEDEKSIQPLKSFADLDINKPIKQNFNRVMSRDSIKFATRNQKLQQSQTSIRVFTAKEQVYVDQSNIFGVNLLEQQKKHQFEQSEQQSARSMLSESDGNIICESVNRGDEAQIEESGGMADVEMESGCDDQTPDIFLKKSIKPMHLNFEKTLQDFPPLLQTTMTNIASNFSQRSPKSNHSDDQVEVRRALEESENAMRNDIEKQPQLHRQSTHSLLNKTKEQKEADIESVQISLDKKVDNSLDREIICTTPADLLVILGQHQRSVKPKRGLGETMEIFNDDVVHDVIDENSNDEYSRKPPKNNNFMGRPMTAQKNKNQIQI